MGETEREIQHTTQQQKESPFSIIANQFFIRLSRVNSQSIFANRLSGFARTIYGKRDVAQLSRRAQARNNNCKAKLDQVHDKCVNTKYEISVNMQFNVKNVCENTK